MRTVGIYRIVSPSNKIYIGQSWDVKKRMKSYKSHNCSSQPAIYNSIKKHGWPAHNVDVVFETREDVSQATLDFWEEYFMEVYKQAGYELLNLKTAGSNGKLSEESKEKIRQRFLGKPKSPSHIVKMRAVERTPEWNALISKNHADFSGANHPQYGSRHKESTKRLIGAANSRYIRTEKHRKNTSKSLLGRPCPMKGKKHTPQSRKNMGDAHRKPVLQFDMDGVFIKEWPSFKDAAKSVNLASTNISACCHGRAKSAGGFLWKNKLKIL